MMNTQIDTLLIPRDFPRAMGRPGIILCWVILSTVSLEGVAQESDDAVASLRVAAEQGDVDAQYNLGARYANGEGISQNFTEAVRWFRMAAEQGHAEAQYNLGVMYDEGQGVAQNYEEAVRWYRMAAEQGHAYAQHNLGFMYANGQGVAQDFEEAVQWYQAAAEQGDAGAQLNLGLMYWMYAEGLGIAQDYAEAYAWIRTAAAQGFGRAEEARQAVLKEMTPSQVERGEELAREYQERFVTFPASVSAQGEVTDGRYHSAREWFSVPVPTADAFWQVPFAVQGESVNRADVGNVDIVTFWIKDFGEVFIASVWQIPESTLANMREEDDQTVLSNLANKALHDWRDGIPNSLPIEPKVIEDTFVSTPHGEAILRVYLAERGSLLAEVSGPAPDKFDTLIAVIVAKQEDYYVYAIAENDADGDAFLRPDDPARGTQKERLKQAVESFFSGIVVHR